MSRGAIQALKTAIVREAVPAAKAAVTVFKRHGGRMAQDWAREFGRERKKATKSLEPSDGQKQ